MDWNVQLDIQAAQTVLHACTPLLVPCGPCRGTALRRAHIPRLRAAGPLGELLARQAEAFDAEWCNAERCARDAPCSPPDTLNFLYDPLAGAIATGWRQGVRIKRIGVRCEEVDGWLVQRVDPSGQPVDVVVSVDGPAFSEAWVQRVTA
jgi:hypothetical protein